MIRFAPIAFALLLASCAAQMTPAPVILAEPGSDVAGAPAPIADEIARAEECQTTGDGIGGTGCADE